MAKYAGITIGPIIETISESSSPALLWFSSTFFSELTKKLCKKISAGMHEVIIYSPYFEEGSSLLPEDDGIGKFHDRIIFKANEINGEKLDAIITTVKGEMEECFPEKWLSEEQKKYLNQYLQIPYIILDETKISAGENVINVISPYLDTLELMRNFPGEENANPFRYLTNDVVKASNLFKHIDPQKNFLVKKNSDGLISIGEIASSSYAKELKEYKKKNYFAVVHADGDNMGKTLNSVPDAEVIKFSKLCLDYTQQSVELIKGFGGMPIYAGGDDLLFLAPVENAKNETVFDLCQNINKKFHEIFNTLNVEKTESSVSFGVSIQYQKFPLYEALEKSRKLLFVEAKAKKNCIAISLEKHSGQTVSLCVANEAADKLSDFLNIDHALSEADQVVTSVQQKFGQFREMFHILSQKTIEKGMDEDTFVKTVLNFFDNEGQKAAENYIRAIAKFYYNVIVNHTEDITVICPLKGESNHEDVNDDTISLILSLLRLKKFFVEKGEER